MGLREDAEAARLRAINKREEEARAKECAREERERQRRARVEEEAREAAWDIGIGELDEAVWVTNPPIAVGYNPETFLQLRSPDGVWLRYSFYQYREGAQHRWMVVQKCPVDDHWVRASGWATTLDGIGHQLSTGWHVLEQHLAEEHPDYRQ